MHWPGRHVHLPVVVQLHLKLAGAGADMVCWCVEIRGAERETLCGVEKSSYQESDL